MPFYYGAKSLTWSDDVGIPFEILTSFNKAIFVRVSSIILDVFVFYNLQVGKFQQLTDPNLADSLQQISFYYNYFAESNVLNPTFAVPFNDTYGLGEHALTFQWLISRTLQYVITICYNSYRSSIDPLFIQPQRIMVNNYY